MQDLYVLVDDHTIESYNNEILKRVVGDKVVKVIANPTEVDLKEFGYMELVTNELIPEYDSRTQILETKYSVKDGKIYQSHRVTNMPTDDAIDM